MKTIFRRVGRLEGCYRMHLSGTPKDSLRVLVSCRWKSLDLADSTCTRTLTAVGTLMEVIHLSGSDEDISEDDLERFIKSFPIEKQVCWDQ